MSVQIIPRDKQANGEFNGGEVLEKKPIGFPQDGGTQKPYSNLFYWAHAWSEIDSQLGLHPHQGFEILSFVMEGEINHYDTKNKKWLPLKKGDAQIIRSGNGISHSEIFKGGCSMFQIWFDPDISKTLSKPASYDDYTASAFPVSEKNGIKTKIYKGENAPILMDSEGVVIKEIEFGKNQFKLDLETRKVFSAFLVDGELEIEGQKMNKEDFVIAKDASFLSVKSNSGGRLFVIETPAKLSYQTYAERFLI